MAGVKEYFQTELEKQLDHAKSLTDQAESEGRNLTDDEREQVKTALAKATEFKTKVEDLEANEAMRKSIEDLGKGLTSKAEQVDDDNPPASVGEAFVKSEGYRALKQKGLEGRWSTTIQIPETLWTKANTGFVAFTEGNNANLYQIQREPGVQLPIEQRLTIADLLGQGTVSPGNNTITYVRETVTNNGAAVVAEGAAKPPSDIGFKTETTSLVKLATTLTVSDEMLDDVAAIQSYLNNRLSLFVRQEEESQLLRGGGGSNISGILDHTIGDQAASDIGGDNLFDSILAAITYIRTNAQLEPDAMVMHPSTFAQISVLKTSTGGTYFSGGPYASPNNNPWGLRQVLTTAISVGHVLVGAFRQGATVWRKGGLTVEATNGFQDYFQKNLTMIRAEERVGLTVYRDQAFCLAREGS